MEEWGVTSESRCPQSPTGGYDLGSPGRADRKRRGKGVDGGRDESGKWTCSRNSSAQLLRNLRGSGTGEWPGASNSHEDSGPNHGGVVIIAVVLSGCGSGTASTRVLTGRTSPKGPITGQQAIAIVEQDGRVVLGTAPPSCHCAHPYQELEGIKRIAAKLTTFEGLLALANPGALVPGSPESGSDRVWVVAVAATVHPSMGLTREKADTWAVSVIDQQTGEEVEFTAGATGNWPPFFDALPDLSHA